ncbi:AMP nucleosidase [Ottowia testudinis]|uniref:AMP nucleosidase n=1 Tax=Ottowia testudinis TaxID=2816950 RepID=A0A975CET9_9BURK|nr:AMP nucleosidase [Ottowia testudinis]QTD45080.1 AMP nucleosidase [Ottowia testudinis]
MISLPLFVPPAPFTDAAAALAQVRRIYNAGCTHLREALAAYIAGSAEPDGPLTRVRAFYPFVRVHVPHGRHPDTRLAYGFVSHAGHYETTLTRPDLFAGYYEDQFRLLLANHGATLEVGTSSKPIPLPFALAEDEHFDGALSATQRQRLSEVFDLPDLTSMDDRIANGTHTTAPGDPDPLALFTAARVDYSLHRLRHYTGTSPDHFQNFILFTNYQFYIDEFIALGQLEMQNADSAYSAFVQPGNVITCRAGLPSQLGDDKGIPPPRLPQMPAYHLVRPDRGGISFVNIGVGPANAKTITDHIAVLRPHAWIMVGHCAGLRNSQQLGDYVLAHGYVREDHVLDEDLPLWIPVPALAEVQIALQDAVADVTGLIGDALKRVLRTGTVATTDNRNWELLGAGSPQRRFSQSRAVALDMESATIAANGFRFRVPYGTLLCVSDKPLHGEIKLPGMANHFYRERVNQHLKIGIRAIERLRENGLDQLHSRKLRSFAEVAFQ